MRLALCFLSGLVTGIPSGALVGLAILVGACKAASPALTPTDVVNISAETLETQACDRDYPDSGAAYEACFTAVTKRFDVIDGTDGGAD